jgi:hypothetical protein
MPATEQVASFHLMLNEAERAELLRLLDRDLRDTHVEARRTESLEFQEGVHHREHTLRALIEKLRHP